MKKILLWVYRCFLIILTLLFINMGLWELFISHNLLLACAGLIVIPFEVNRLLWH